MLQENHLNTVSFAKISANKQNNVAVVKVWFLHCSKTDVRNKWNHSNHNNEMYELKSASKLNVISPLVPTRFHHKSVCLISIRCHVACRSCIDHDHGQPTDRHVHLSRQRDGNCPHESNIALAV